MPGDLWDDQERVWASCRHGDHDECPCAWPVFAGLARRQRRDMVYRGLCECSCHTEVKDG